MVGVDLGPCASKRAVETFPAVSVQFVLSHRFCVEPPVFSEKLSKTGGSACSKPVFLVWNVSEGWCGSVVVLRVVVRGGGAVRVCWGKRL